MEEKKRYLMGMEKQQVDEKKVKKKINKNKGSMSGNTCTSCKEIYLLKISIVLKHNKFSQQMTCQIFHMSK